MGLSASPLISALAFLEPFPSCRLIFGALYSLGSDSEGLDLWWAFSRTSFGFKPSFRYFRYYLESAPLGPISFLMSDLLLVLVFWGRTFVGCGLCNVELDLPTPPCVRCVLPLVCCCLGYTCLDRSILRSTQGPSFLSLLKYFILSTKFWIETSFCQY